MLNWRQSTKNREIVGKCLQEERDSSDIMGKPMKCEDNRVMQAHDGTVKLVESRTRTHSARSWFSRSS